MMDNGRKMSEPALRTTASSRFSVVREWIHKYGLYFALLLLALLRGAAYANFMPPWGIIDEEQHVHYVQVLSEEGRRPNPNKDYLSSEIIASLYETKRWDTFGFVSPPSHDPRSMGLEGYSYEGYQPPLYYLVLVPIYNLIDGAILQALFAMRWTTVVLSTLTVLFTYLLTQTLTRSKPLALFAALILVLIPERTAAVSRVNNDALLEVFAAVYLWLSIRSVKEGLNDKRAFLLGLFLGLGTLSKMSGALLVITLPFIFLVNRRQYSLSRGIALSGGTAAALILPLAASNLHLFGDPTGFSAVAPMLTFTPPALSVINFLQSLLSIFTNFWVILWQSASAAVNPIFSLLHILMFALTCLSLYGLVHHARGRKESKLNRREATAYWMLITLVALYGFFTLISYWRGQVPVIQGRFLLPAIPALVTLLIIGLRRAPLPSATFSLLVLGLVLMYGLSLFGHLLPQYYPLDSNLPASRILEVGVASSIGEFIRRTASFKPDIVRRALRATMLGYIGAQGLAIAISCWIARRLSNGSEKGHLP